MTKSKIILIGAIAIAGSTASLLIQHEAHSRLRENDAALREQDNQLAGLAAEHQRLSNLVAQANSSPAEDQTAELAKLRSEAATLRKQTNELGKQLAENRRSRQSQTRPRPRSDTHVYPGMVSVVSESNSEEYAKQLDRMTHDKMGDVRNLSSAVRKYASEHQGEYPTNFDQEFSRISEFEMVYQGSYNELTNVPWQEVALIRERQAWPTPSGKWARIYVTASGLIEIVESDDNFQSWEAEHIIPPPSAGQ